MSTSNKDADKWNAIYQSKLEDLATTKLTPAYILQKLHHLLPAQGKALDLASGLGANALFLAERNMQSYAWDISSIAIDKLKKTATTLGLKINTEVRDVVANPPVANSFDVIVVSHFLNRQIIPDIIAALRDDGLLFYQTFTITAVKDAGPSSDKYRLGKNELLNLCGDLELIIYQENTLDNAELSLANEALLIGRCKRTI